MAEKSKNLSNDNEPLYNIGAVSRMTGVTETTLRVWERRYNFPISSRTEGGHRLYSQHEVSRLQWVKTQVDNRDMKISRAIKALLHMENEGGSVDTQTTNILSSASDGDAFAAFYQKLLASLLSLDAELSDRIVAEALTVYPLEYLILQIVSPIMNEVGSAWERGEIDVATEHFATNFLRHHLLRWLRTGPPTYNVSPIILSCAPGELHEGSLLMLAVLLRRLRWPVSYLGQSIALHDFKGFVEQLKPSAIVFVAMTEQTAQALSDWPRWLPEVYEANRPLVCFGGRIFSIEPQYIDEVPGIFLGQTLEEGISVLHKILNDMNPLAR